MLIVGSIDTKKDAAVITDIAKTFLVGQRAQFLSSTVRK